MANPDRLSGRGVTYQQGDRVVKPSTGEFGRIQFRKNWTTGERFPVVVILDGRRRGQSEYPNRGWELEESATYDRPDHDEDSITTTENKAVRLWRERWNR